MSWDAAATIRIAYTTDGSSNTTVVKAAHGSRREHTLRAIGEQRQPARTRVHGDGTSQSDRTARVTSRRSRHRSAIEGRPQNQYPLYTEYTVKSGNNTNTVGT